MKQIRMPIVVLAISVLAVFGAQAAEVKAATPARAEKVKPYEPEEGKTNGERWWRGNNSRIMHDIAKMDGKIDIAIVGDSITARWRGELWEKHWGAYRAVNMGIGGDQTQHVLWRLQNGNLDGYKARLFIVMIGTNNMWDKNADPNDVALGVKAILDEIAARQPQANILLLGIFPTGEKPNPGRERRGDVNQLISKFAGGKVHYMDIGDKFIDPDGIISKEVMGDSLHLAPKGYDIWVESISGKVEELLGRSKQ